MKNILAKGRYTKAIVSEEDFFEGRIKVLNVALKAHLEERREKYEAY